MAAVSSELFDRPLIVPVPRLLTAADLAALPDELPTGPVKYELDNGRLVTKAPAGEPHADSQISIITELMIQGERRGHGSQPIARVWRTSVAPGWSHCARRRQRSGGDVLCADGPQHGFAT